MKKWKRSNNLKRKIKFSAGLERIDGVQKNMIPSMMEREKERTEFIINNLPYKILKVRIK